MPNTRIERLERRNEQLYNDCQSLIDELMVSHMAMIWTQRFLIDGKLEDAARQNDARLEELNG